MERNTVTDKEFDACMQRMRQGEKQALKEVYENYLPYIYAIVLGVVGNRENAEDVTSEFFIKLWKVSDTYKPGRGHRAWLGKIARNLSVDFLRKTKREVFSDSMEEAMAGLQEDGEGSRRKNHEGNIVNITEKKSSVEAEVIEELSIEEALSRLNEKEREVVHLKIMGQLSFKEIASLLEEPMGSVTWRYQNAMKKLRRCGYE